MPSMMRRMRTRLPTYLSTGLGALVDISNTPWDTPFGTRHDESYASGADTVKSCSEASGSYERNFSGGRNRAVLDFWGQNVTSRVGFDLWISSHRCFCRLTETNRENKGVKKSVSKRAAG